jgi:hypothetical protein
MKLDPATEHRLQQGLLVLAIVLAIATIAEILISRGPATSTQADDPAGPARVVAQASGPPPLEDYAVIIERPLFFETRHPYAPEQIVEAGPVRSEPAPALALSAIVIADDRRIAIVEAGRNDVQRLRPGESIQGWTLTGVEAQRATFTRGGETMTLELTVPAAANTPGARRPPVESEPPKPDTEAAEASPQTGDNSPAPPAGDR